MHVRAFGGPYRGVVRRPKGATPNMFYSLPNTSPATPPVARTHRHPFLRTTRSHLAATIAAVLGGSVLLVSPAQAAVPSATDCHATPTSVTFDYTGAAQTFTVPDSVRAVDITIAGASGGDWDQPAQTYPAMDPWDEPFTTPARHASGGSGLAFTTTGDVTPGEELTVVVGGAGVTAYDGSWRAQGGGGGSFVYTAPTGVGLLAAAGGGGGSAVDVPGQDAQDGPAGDGHGGPGGDGGDDSGGGGGAGLLSGGADGGPGWGNSWYPATGGHGGSAAPTFNGGDGGYVSLQGRPNYGTTGGYGGGGGGGTGGFVGGGGGGGGGGFTGGTGGATGQANVYNATGGAPGTSYSPHTKSRVTTHHGNGSVTLTWPPTTAVDFDTAGGDTAPAPQLVVTGCTATEPSAPTRDGYTFTGWSTSSTGGNAWDFTTAATSDTTLYAQWQPAAPLKGPQTITVTTDPGAPHPGDTYTPSATSTSNLPVSITVNPASTQVCHLSDGIVTFDASGDCEIRYDQTGDTTHTAADQVTQQVVVTKAAATVAVTFDPASPLYGQSGVAHVVGTDTSTGDPLEGTVHVSVDGSQLPAVPAPQGAADVTVTGTNVAPLDAGTHQVDVTFTPNGARHDSAHSSAVLTIGQAQTTTALTVTPIDVTAAVAAAAPAHGNPTGTVTFYLGQHDLGTATVHDGVARLTYQVPSGAEQAVSAVFAGSTNWSQSSDSTVRRDPAITARVSATRPKSGSGWYRTPVTIRFTCTTHGASLTGPCPAAVTLTRNGGAQSITRIIRAADGGVATLAVTGINIDRTAPSLRVVGVRDQATYATSPSLRCRVTDTVSGVGSCQVTRKATGGRGPTTVYSYRAVARDRAGNQTVRTGHYRLLKAVVAGAPFRNGAFRVHAGHTYTLVVTSKTRPTYYDAAVAPRKPTGHGHGFVKAGRDRWTLGVTLNKGMRRYPLWNIGVKNDGRMHQMRLRIS